jgi:hypothetical protein
MRHKTPRSFSGAAIGTIPRLPDRWGPLLVRRGGGVDDRLSSLGTPQTVSQRRKAAEAVDIAARYLLYKLYDATPGRPDVWQALGSIGEKPEAMARC